MGVFLTYPTNIFPNLNNEPQVIVAATAHPLWITSILICNRGAAPMRFNMQKFRLNGFELEHPAYAGSVVNINAIYNNGINGVGATLTNNGPLVPFTIDGVSNIPLNSRILIKNQNIFNTFQNGIYVLSVIGNNTTPWVLSRSLDYDTPRKIQAGDIITILNGTVNANTKWNQTASVTTIGTSPIIFVPETSISIYHINELEIQPYDTLDIIDITGVLQLQFSRFPFISDSLVCFSNGYTQVFDCDVNYARLNELP